MGKLKEAAWVLFFLVILILVNELALIRWCRKDTRPLAWDESIHASLSVEYRNRIRDEGFRSVFHPAYFNYPPLYHLLVATVLDLPSDVADAGAIINGVVLAALIVVVFLLGQTFLGPWEGLAAAFFLTCFPGVVDLTRPPMIDLMLTFWVALGFYCLYWSENFTRWSWSLAFGVASGLGMLTKWSYAIYLLVPFVWTAYRSFRMGSPKKLFVGVALAAILMSPWYIENFVPMMTMFRRVTSLAPAGVAELSGWRNALWYFFEMGEALNIYFFLLLIPGLFVAFWRPKTTGVLVWYVSGLVLFTLIRNHNVRYAVPVLPAAALLCVAWLPAQRRWVLGLACVGAAICFVFQQSLPQRRSVTTVASVPFTIWSNQAPRNEDWKHREVIQKVLETKEKDRFCRIVILSNAPCFHSTTLNLSAQMAGAKDIVFLGPSKNRWLDFKDFILAKTGDLGPAETLGNIRPDADMVLAPPDWFKKTYREVGRWPLPDRSEAILYKADPQPVKGLGADALQLSLKKLTIGNIDLDGIDVRVTPISAADTALGRFKELRVRATKISTKDLTFEHADLRLIQPQVSLPRFLETGEIQVLSADALDPHLELASDLITSYAARKIKGLSDPQVSFKGSEASLKAIFHGIPLSVIFSYLVHSESLEIHLDHVKVGFLPIPNLFLSGITDRKISLRPGDEIPFQILVTQISGNGSTLKVGS